MKAQLERLIRDMDVVSREEFEAVREMAVLAREENERLEARIAALEARLGTKLRHAADAGRPTTDPAKGVGSRNSAARLATPHHVVDGWPPPAGVSSVDIAAARVRRRESTTVQLDRCVPRLARAIVRTRSDSLA